MSVLSIHVDVSQPFKFLCLWLTLIFQDTVQKITSIIKVVKYNMMLLFVLKAVIGNWQTLSELMMMGRSFVASVFILFPPALTFLQRQYQMKKFRSLLLFHASLLLIRQNQLIVICPSSLRCFRPFFPFVSHNAIIYCFPAPPPASWFWFLLLCLFFSLFFHICAVGVDVCMLVMVLT